MGQLTSDVAEARSAVIAQQVVTSNLENQLGESSAKVSTLTQDLISAQESYQSTVQVLHCNCEYVKSNTVFFIFKSPCSKTEIT